MDPTTFDPGPLAEVSSEEHGDGTWTVTFVRELAHAPEHVWDALRARRRDPEVGAVRVRPRPRRHRRGDADHRRRRSPRGDDE